MFIYLFIFYFILFIHFYFGIFLSFNLESLVEKIADFVTCI